MSNSLHNQIGAQADPQERAIRISLALAIARIWPPRDPTRMFAIGMAFMSVAFCAIVIVRSVTLCAHQPALVSGPDAACHWSLDLRVLVVAGMQ